VKSQWATSVVVDKMGASDLFLDEQMVFVCG
jgi:hypothetical protein